MHKKAKKQDSQIKRKKRNLWSGIDEPSRGSEGGAGRASQKPCPVADFNTCVAIPCRHQNNNTACAHDLKVRIDTKWRKFRNTRKLRRLIVTLIAPQGLSQSGCTAGQQSTSLAPQDLKKSQSSAGFIKSLRAPQAS